jgi:Uma2 family endonuclease
MTEPYEEILAGEVWRRHAPGERHERICTRLHDLVAASLGQVQAARLLPARALVQVRTGTMLRPDLALVTVATGKLWLAAEIISSDDHRTDTVSKKAIYEEVNVPRLWMLDPRYDNVEVYHEGEYGLALRGILAGSEVLRESLLPSFAATVRDLFVG